MELHLFRHGETDWNKAGRFQGQYESRLTEKGVLQAQNLGKKIAGIEFHKIYCSPSLRTRQTASYMWPNLPSDIEYMDTLMEINLGPLEGQLYQDVEKNDPSSHDHFFNKPHLFNLKGAETFAKLTNRAVTTITEISIEKRNQTVAIVSHGAFIKAFLTKIDGKEIHQIWDPPYMDNCAHNIVVFKSDDSFQIIQIADVKRSP
tara:strand:- start:28 stop:636 length:609 start_codon:yes stop_codon:yes gene_type:complete